MLKDKADLKVVTDIIGQPVALFSEAAFKGRVAQECVVKEGIRD
ncbi:hypothetical protein HMPREF1982_03922 [Clostridiales bacterium oral taxon 876 str. F0540]|nr:hypothetical protein HMPREF1982_03922 [Clostridiales bacterium oral taxon 876 str. F0540]